MKLQNIIKIKRNIKDLIRLGRPADGGYVVSSKALQTADTLYTYGVANDYSFESDYVNMFKKHARMFDPTISQIALPEYLTLDLEGLYVKNNTPTLFEHIKKYNNEYKKIFLKIDIEGHEYNFFESITCNELQNVTGMVVEFHNLEILDIRNRFKEILIKLYESFDIVHIHGNNHGPLMSLNNFLFPNTPEISFIQKNINEYIEEDVIHYPLLPLDKPNIYFKQDYSFTINNNESILG